MSDQSRGAKECEIRPVDKVIAQNLINQKVGLLKRNMRGLNERFQYY